MCRTHLPILASFLVGTAGADPVPLDCLSGLTEYTDAGRTLYAFDSQEDYIVTQGESISGSGATIRLWDVSDPAQPVLASASAPTPGFLPRIVEVSYPLVVSTQGNGWPGPSSLRVFDFSDSNAPAEVATIGSTVQAAELVAQTLYIIDDDSLKIYDLADPAAPALIGSTPLPGVSANDLAVDAGYAFTVGDSVRIVDVSVPSAPAQVGAYPAANTRGVAHADGMLYVTSSTTQSLLILDLADPANPTLRSQVPAPSCIDIDVIDSTAYVGQWYGGVARIDVTDPDAPQPLDALNSPAFIEQMLFARSGSTLFAMAATGFSRIQTDPVRPNATSRITEFGPGMLPANTRIADARFADGIGYLCDTANDTLHIIDADAAVPSVIGSLPLAFEPRTIELAGGFAFVAGSSSELLRIDVSDPSTPFPSGSLALPVWSIKQMVQRDGRLYLMSPGVRFVIVDLTDPAAPAVLGQADTSIEEELLGIDANGDTLVLIEGSQQAGATFYYLTKFDISNPAAPVESGRRLIGRDARNVALNGAVAWVVISNTTYDFYTPGTLAAFDVSGQGTPQELGSIRFGGTSLDFSSESEFLGLLIDADRAIVSHKGQVTGMATFDITDPTTPRLLGSSPGQLADWITRDGDLVYAGLATNNRINAYLDGACQSGPGCSSADLAEPYGQLDFFDLAAYLDLYNAGDPAADLAEPFGVLNFFDLAAYLDAFNAGCP